MQVLSHACFVILYHMLTHAILAIVELQYRGRTQIVSFQFSVRKRGHRFLYFTE